MRSEWVSPDEEGLGCHEHLSSQIFRQSGHSGVSQRKSGTKLFIKRRLDRVPPHEHLRTIGLVRTSTELNRLEGGPIVAGRTYKTRRIVHSFDLFGELLAKAYPVKLEKTCLCA